RFANHGLRRYLTLSGSLFSAFPDGLTTTQPSISKIPYLNFFDYHRDHRLLRRGSGDGVGQSSSKQSASSRKGTFGMSLASWSEDIGEKQKVLKNLFQFRLPRVASHEFLLSKK